MPYTTRKKSDKEWELLNPDGTVKRTYTTEEAAEDRADDLNEREEHRTWRSGVEDRLRRMPVKEMTAEEKAAEYDRMMTQQVEPPTQPHGNSQENTTSTGNAPTSTALPAGRPPAPQPKTPVTEPTVTDSGRRRAWYEHDTYS